ncbi:MAG: integrase arm-type DNA-binding domain-containing protein [Betaproteobacteria bacterium]
MMKLTAREIATARYGVHADGDGLYLQVSKTGAKSWIYRYQIDGRRREMGLGSALTVTGPMARALAAEKRALVRGKQKVDPIEVKRQEAAERARAAAEARAKATSFRDVALDYIASHKAGWKNAKHGDQWVNTLTTYAFPKLGDQSVTDITREMVLKVLSPIWTTKTETATRVRSRIELVLGYAKARGLREGENPAVWRGNLDKLLPKPRKVAPVEHRAALPYDRMSEFMEALRTMDGIGARALEFTILCAARSGEVRLAKWQEFDLEAKVWTIPGARMKAGREHRVPLSDAAVALLKGLPHIEGDERVFLGTRRGQFLSDMTLLNVIRRMNKSDRRFIDPRTGGDIVPHGFRSSFRDWHAEVTHYPHELAEMALAHVVGSKVEAAYRRGDMFDKRRQMMNDWAAWCAPRSEPEHVAPVREKVAA